MVLISFWQYSAEFYYFSTIFQNCTICHCHLKSALGPKFLPIPIFFISSISFQSIPSKNYPYNLQISPQEDVTFHNKDMKEAWLWRRSYHEHSRGFQSPCIHVKNRCWKGTILIINEIITRYFLTYPVRYAIFQPTLRIRRPKLLVFLKKDGCWPWSDPFAMFGFRVTQFPRAVDWSPNALRI